MTSKKCSKKRFEEKNSEISKVKNELKVVADKLKSEIFNSKVDLEENKNRTEKKNMEIIDIEFRHTEVMESHEALKLKVEELMNIIDAKNIEIEELQNNDKSQSMVFTRNEILQKEMLVLKVSLQQKDLDIKSLNELLVRKAGIITQNDSAIEQYVEEVNLLKKSSNGENEKIEARQQPLASEENEKIIKNLQQKIVNEQEINKQSEDEIINLKIELDNIKQESIIIASQEKANPKEDQIKLLKSKDEEIDKLKKEIAQEQQIIAHVQVTQEREIIEKEKKIFILNKILTQERQVFNEKEKDKECMQSKFQASYLTDVQSDDDSETVTFHDALSDEEDVLIEDLPFDRERKSDVDDFSLG